jgi:hypothetical protein
MYLFFEATMESKTLEQLNEDLDTIRKECWCSGWDGLVGTTSISKQTVEAVRHFLDLLQNHSIEYFLLPNDITPKPYGDIICLDWYYPPQPTLSLSINKFRIAWANTKFERGHVDLSTTYRDIPMSILEQIRLFDLARNT